MVSPFIVVHTRLSWPRNGLGRGLLAARKSVNRESETACKDREWGM